MLFAALAVSTSLLGVWNSCCRAPGAFFNKKVGDFERLSHMFAVGMKIEMNVAPLSVATPDGKYIAVARLVGAGFKPALVPQARCERIAVISC
jgi:hypothetical protein